MAATGTTPTRSTLDDALRGVATSMFNAWVVCRVFECTVATVLFVGWRLWVRVSPLVQSRQYGRPAAWPCGAAYSVPCVRVSHGSWRVCGVLVRGPRPTLVSRE
jgi:hypothetical protein